MAERKGIALPPEFIVRMNAQLGDQADSFFKSLAGPPPVSIRINPKKWNIAAPADPVSWSKYGFYLPERPSFTLDPFLHGGAYYVQEAGSMLLEKAFLSVKREEPMVILDLCGAPGGKSTHLLSLLGHNDLLVSNEVIRSRAYILQENIRKWGYSNVVVTNSDPRDFTRLGPVFDVVVLDAPCSGEGLFRKDQGAISEWSENNARLCAARQRRIMTDVWECLKPGGHLIYSTCTYNPAENEENLQWLSEQQDAEAVEIDLDPSWNLITRKFRNITGYQAFPHHTKSEGFFIGIIKRKGEPVRAKNRSAVLKHWIPAPAKSSQQFKCWMKESGTSDFLVKGDDFYFFAGSWHSVLSLLEKHLAVLQAGIPIATVKGTSINPHPAMALAVGLNSDEFVISDLPLEEAIRYLQKENLASGVTVTGWQLVTYRDLPLGWQKNLGNRTNNYFPGEWRIRMRPDEIPVPWHEAI